MIPLIPTLVHGVIDYLVGLLVIAAPYLFGFATGGAKQWVPMLLGMAVIAYSLMTRYELGLMPVIPMRGHLGLDVAFGALLAASPWLFGFAKEVYLPHLVVGLLAIAITAFSDPRPRAVPTG